MSGEEMDSAEPALEEPLDQPGRRGLRQTALGLFAFFVVALALTIVGHGTGHTVQIVFILLVAAVTLFHLSGPVGRWERVPGRATAVVALLRVGIILLLGLLVVAELLLAPTDQPSYDTFWLRLAVVVGIDVLTIPLFTVANRIDQAGPQPSSFNALRWSAAGIMLATLVGVLVIVHTPSLPSETQLTEMTLLQRYCVISDGMTQDQVAYVMGGSGHPAAPLFGFAGGTATVFHDGRVDLQVDYDNSGRVNGFETLGLSRFPHGCNPS